MFSETRYAMNGDLRVAYRASRAGPRDIVFVPNWFTCCEHLPELPSIQGWVEAMTSLGRLIFFDQPGTGASDPVSPGALPTLEHGPTASPRCSTTSGAAKRSSSRSNGAFAPAALFAATHPSRTTALVALEGYADPHDGTDGSPTRGSPRCLGRRVGHGRVRTRAQSRHAVERGDPGDVGSTWNAWRRAREPSLS